jgi:hypothetical protein
MVKAKLDLKAVKAAVKTKIVKRFVPVDVKGVRESIGKLESEWVKAVKTPGEKHPERKDMLDAVAKAVGGKDVKSVVREMGYSKAKWSSKSAALKTLQESVISRVAGASRATA